MTAATDELCGSGGPTLCAPSTSCQALRHAVCSLYTLDDFNIDQFLGEGFFATVFKVTHKSTGATMVLKMCRQEAFGYNNNISPVQSKCGGQLRTNYVRPNINSSRYRHQRILREVELINKLRHPNVLNFIGICIDRSVAGAWQVHALTEHCNGGSLQSLILDRLRSVSWLSWANLALDVATGMCYVHQNGYMHRDLTSMNILLKQNGYLLRALVADFGLACRIPKANEANLPQVGTPYWMAPECLREQYYGPPADVFSFGMIMCQCVGRMDADPECGLPRTPVFGLDYVEFSRRCPPSSPAPLLRLAFQVPIPDPVKCQISRKVSKVTVRDCPQCCLMDPQRRPTFTAAVRALINVLRSLRQSMCPRECRPVRSVSDEHLLANAYTSETHLTRCVTGSPGGMASHSPSASVLLATSVAQDDPFYEPRQANPFLSVAKYRDGRKIVLSKWCMSAGDRMAAGRTQSASSGGSDADSGCDDAASTSSLPPAVSHLTGRRARVRAANPMRDTVDVGTSPIRDNEPGAELCRHRLPQKFSASDERFAMRHYSKHRHSVQPQLLSGDDHITKMCVLYCGVFTRLEHNPLEPCLAPSSHLSTNQDFYSCVHCKFTN